MKIVKSHFTLGLIAAAVLTLTACGGGGSNSAASNINSAVPMTNKTITVMDGLIQNALVCVDSNANGVCDATEIQGHTDAMGNVTLAIPTADLASAQLLAEIKAGVATDKDTGAIKTSYTLQTPAGTLDVANPVLSPLTNMVQVKINADRAAGISTSVAEADRFVISQLGLSTTGATAVSAFDNFVARSAQGSAEHSKAGERAHLLVVSTQASITSASKGSDSSGAGDNSAHSIETRVENNLLSQLSNIGTVSNIVEHSACASNSTGNVAHDCQTEIDNEVHNDHLDQVGSGSTDSHGTTDTSGSTGATDGTGSTGTTGTTGTTGSTGTMGTTGSTGTTGGVASAAALAGKSLYGMYCASCHGTAPNLDGFVLKGANSSVTISNAIYAVPSKSMGQLSGLSAQDLANIAAYLATPGI